MQYPLLGMKNAEEHCFVRREVYYKLLEATSLLPFNYKFKILDAWRPFDFGDNYWSQYTNNPSIYNGIFTKNKIHLF